VRVPLITAITTDTGASSSDRLTMDQTLVLSGTGTPSSTVNLHLVGAGFIGTATVNSGGAWTFDYTGATLAEGTYAFTADGELDGDESIESAPFVVTVDLTPPDISLFADNVANSGLTLFVSATDLNGLPDGTAVSLDVDYNDDGDFADAGEADASS